MSSDKQLIFMNPMHRNADQACRYVIGLARGLQVPIPKQRKDYNSDILIDLGPKLLRVNLSNQIQQARENGVPDQLQFMHDSKDPFLFPALEIAVSELPKGLNINLGSQIESFEKEAKAPAAMASPEALLAKDIIYYRKQCAHVSDFGGIWDSARHYRSYLQCCVSLADAFLFRYAFFVRERVPDARQYENAQTLDSITGLTERIEAWHSIFAPNAFSVLRQSVEWSQFEEIRRERNRFVHPHEPSVTFTVRDMVKNLNNCRRGIGGLLASMRKAAGQDERIGFIQRVLTAPEVRQAKP